MKPQDDSQQDIDGLLIERALFGQESLSPEELEQLAQHAMHSPDAAAHWEELASLVLASGALATEPAESELLPDGWEERLNARFDQETRCAQTASEVSEAANASTPPSVTAGNKAGLSKGVDLPAASRAQPGRSPWLLSLVLSTAAAFAAGWLIGAWNQPNATEQEPVVATNNWAERYRELSALPSSTRVEWKGNNQGEIAGWVVWNDELQEGFMAFETLAANDPTIEQYQLWIFDAARSDNHPVDGGVFNFSQAAAFAFEDMTLVPIDAKLPVTHAKMFALTVEAPGGVVVSSREKLPGLAIVP